MCTDPCPRCGSQHYAQSTGERPCDRRPDPERPGQMALLGVVCLLLIFVFLYVAFEIGRWLS